MTINEVLNTLDSNPNSGLELTKRKGILTSTWNIFKKKTITISLMSMRN